MLIKIEYESKYSLSTTKNGENILTGMAVITADAKKDVKNIFNSDNDFLKNIKELNKYYPNYQYADITKDTVLGILCRLVGEIRRLNTLDEKHPIIKIKDSITFENIGKDFQNEVIMLHSPLKEVQNNAGGIISTDKEDHFLLSKNKLSETLLSIFNYKSQQEVFDLLNAFKNNDESFFYNTYNKEIKVNTFIKEFMLSEEIQKDLILSLDFQDGDNRLKEIDGRLFYGDSEAILELEVFTKKAKSLDNFKSKMITEKRLSLNKEVNEVFNIYGFLFAKKIQFLRKNGLFEKEFEKSLNKDKTSIKGLAPSSGGLTIKDFYNNFVNEKKMSWTMPYSVKLKRDLFNNSGGEWFNSGASIGVTKESGTLLIRIDISYDEAFDLYQKIENAGVNTFQLGKKGLAYISEIILEE